MNIDQIREVCRLNRIYIKNVIGMRFDGVPEMGFCVKGMMGTRARKWIRFILAADPTKVICNCTEDGSSIHAYSFAIGDEAEHIVKNALVWAGFNLLEPNCPCGIYRVDCVYHQ